MNILLINHYAGSPDMGMEFRSYYMAREWAKSGHNVTIIAGNFSHLRRKNPSVGGDFTKEVIDGINYFWVKSGSYEGNGIKRAITMARFVGKLWMRAKWIAQELKPDVVIASSTYPLDTYAAQRIRRYSGAKYIHEIHDMWPATLVELGGMPRWNPFVVVMQVAENSFCRHADEICSLLPAAKEYLMRHGMKENKFHVIPNGIVCEEWSDPQPLDDKLAVKIKEWKNDGFFIVGYFGGHALSNNLTILLKLADREKDNKIKFVLVGEGTEKDKLIAYANDRGLENVEFWHAIPKRMVPSLVYEFDAIYMGAAKCSLYRFGVCMNKIFDSMMAAKPILYAVEAANNYIDQYRCGITVPADQLDGMQQGLEQLMSLSREEREKMGQNGRSAVLEHFQYGILARKFMEIVQ